MHKPHQGETFERLLESHMQKLPSAYLKPSKPAADCPTTRLWAPHQISEALSIIERSQIIHETVACAEHTTSHTSLLWGETVLYLYIYSMFLFVFSVKSPPKTSCLMEQDILSAARIISSPEFEPSWGGKKRLLGKPKRVVSYCGRDTFLQKCISTLYRTFLL